MENNNRDVFLSAQSLESLKRVRDFISMCVDVGEEGLRRMLISLNDEILNRMTDPTPGEQKEA